MTKLRYHKGKYNVQTWSVIPCPAFVYVASLGGQPKIQTVMYLVQHFVIFQKHTFAIFLPVMLLNMCLPAKCSPTNINFIAKRYYV